MENITEDGIKSSIVGSARISLGRSEVRKQVREADGSVRLLLAASAGVQYQRIAEIHHTARNADNNDFDRNRFDLRHIQG